MTPEEILAELNQLKDLALIIEQPAFQKWFVSPFKEELDKLKYSYDCKNLREMATLKGKAKGYKKFFDQLKSFHGEIESLEGMLREFEK